MTDFDDIERAILAGARRALSPTAVDGARIRLGALTAVSSGTLVDGVDEAIRGTRSGSERLLDWIAAARDGVSASRVVVAALALTGAGGAGYALGFEAGREAEPIAPAPAPMREPTVESAFVPRAEPPSVSNPAPAVAPKPSVPPIQTKTSRQAVVPDAGAPVETDRELRTLRRVESMLRENNPRFALALLDELDRTVENSKLIEERDAARVVARCTLDSPGAARHRAREFAKTHPGSVYLPRVDEACEKSEPER